MGTNQGGYGNLSLDTSYTYKDHTAISELEYTYAYDNLKPNITQHNGVNGSSLYEKGSAIYERWLGVIGIHDGFKAEQIYF